MYPLTITPTTNFEGPHQNQQLVQAGESDAKVAMIMIHGRGATAQSIIGLAYEFDSRNALRIYAPQANGNTWYPFSFLAPTNQNQPGLSSGLQRMYDLVSQLENEGIQKENIFLLGFSQGACLVSEFAARHPAKYAGIIALSGGLIGDKIDKDSYTGDLEGTPYFVGCSNVDPHIPLARVDESAEVFEQLNASVTKKIYPGMGHLVNEDEISHIQKIINTKF